MPNYGYLYKGEINCDESITGATKIQVPYIEYVNDSYNSYKLFDDGGDQYPQYKYTFYGGTHCDGNQQCIVYMPENSIFNWTNESNPPAWFNLVDTTEKTYIKIGKWKLTIRRRSNNNYGLTLYENDIYKSNDIMYCSPSYEYNFFGFVIYNNELYIGWFFYVTDGGYCVVSGVPFYSMFSNAIAITDIIGTGGGATHIAKVTGQLSSLSNNLSDILIVSGGGGGGLIKQSTAYRGSDAGGIAGNGDNSADQSTGYAFGQGDEGCGGGLYGGNKPSD